MKWYKYVPKDLEKIRKREKPMKTMNKVVREYMVFYVTTENIVATYK